MIFSLQGTYHVGLLPFIISARATLMEGRFFFRTTLLALLLGSTTSAWGNSCVECHSQENFYSRFPKLYNYYHDWIESAHSKSGVTCDDCHGGNPEAKSPESAHEGVFPVSDDRSSLYYSRQPATCGACHRDKQLEFEQSKHFRALKSDTKAAPTCTTCHPAMNKRPTYRTIVLNACSTCHQAGNSQGLPVIVENAEDLLRHVNVAHGMIGWANLHFSSHGWPGNSREEMQQFEKRYDDIVDQIHRFDLPKSDKSITDLLTELKTLFDTERSAVEGDAAP